MIVVNMLEAETQVSRLVEAIESGAEQEILIARNGKPVARLGPIGDSPRKGKRLGLLERQYPSSTQEDLDANNDEIARLFRGED